MSNKNWTPGPWEAHGTLVCFPNIASGLWVNATPNPEANAHLIAAAPEMYWALQMVLDDPESLEGRPRTAAVIRAALEKARGEA